MKSTLKIALFFLTFLWSMPIVMAQTKVKKDSTYEDTQWETFGMPGTVAQAYIPDIKDSIGSFRGISIEYLIVAWIHKNDNKGPSHGRIYAKVNFMKSTKPNISDIFYMALGLDLSLERNPQRRYMIPYFGMEIGSMRQKQFGNVFAITPTFGTHIYSSPNLFINLTGGYVYPSKYLEELRGYSLQLGINLSFW